VETHIRFVRSEPRTPEHLGGNNIGIVTNCGNPCTGNEGVGVCPKHRGKLCSVEQALLAHLWKIMKQTVGGVQRCGGGRLTLYSGNDPKILSVD